MIIYKFHELRNRESAYFQRVVRYCREIFHCSGRDIDSLVGKLLAEGSDRVRAHIIYAECLGELAGFVIFYYYPMTKVGFVDAMVVIDDFRNQGIGSQLYYRMVEFLKEHYPQCTGHILEMCQDRDNYLKRKAFFLRQGCIPIDLSFFISDHFIADAGIQLLYHPYMLDQQYTLSTMKNILREMSGKNLH
ncbi:MAG: hypothetical protein CVU89_15160 [Firmicutes bacterium HGW-Firmicutes-14]|nr:MAG: hypothetical protein CVU89_15160 [Firmicutes bacterium HGW-Firmicutes-14]